MSGADVIVVGAGPAGIAAATAAAGQGFSVLVLDDNLHAGGQIWRGGIPLRHEHEGKGPRARALDRLARSGAQVLTCHTVFDADPKASFLHVLRTDLDVPTPLSLRYGQLILATGARERFLPFPGWTLPGVFGAGGLQALVKGGFSVEGKRLAVAGTGPLLLAVAAHLGAQGATVTCIAEQAPPAALIEFALSLWRQPGKLWQGARYKARLWRSPHHLGCWPTAALADAAGRLRAVRLSNGRRTWEAPCDLLACGFHLVPNNGLATLLGCDMNGAFVKVDDQQRTSLPNVFCAGEPTGIAGLEAALTQGEIAGLACAQKSTNALARRAARERAFATRLESAFALRKELRTLATPDTLLCRCEDVPLSRLQPHTGWTEAKLQTRCGMGACQGRLCGPIVETVLGWTPVSVRSPLFPVPLAALCAAEDFSQSKENV